MGLYIDFKDYDSRTIKKRPTRVTVPLRDKKFVFEIAMNRNTEALMLSIYDMDSVAVLSGVRLVPNVDFAMHLSEETFLKDVSVWAQWENYSDKGELIAFMNEFKLYVGGV